MDLDSFVKVEKEFDPAADFIAREQDILSEIEGDFSFPTVEPVTIKEELPEISELSLNDENVDKTSINVEDDDQVSAITETVEATVNGEMNGFSAVFTEPEKISRWRAASIAMLQEKDEEEAQRKQELVEQAKSELEEWYTQYNDQLNRCKTNNRNAEAEWIAERDAEIPGKEWEKITKMCDFNPKPNQKSIKDTSRMRSLLVHLKQNPPQESS